MATQITETLVDDIDGGAATTTVQFAFDGKTFEIDLNQKNAKRFEDLLRPYTAAGRRVTKAGTRKTGSDPKLLAKIRLWAAENGIEVSSRGRISQSVIDAYQAAN